MDDTQAGSGVIVRIAGPVVGVLDLPHVRLNDVALVGHDRLVGEVIRMDGRISVVQVYEDTSGIQVGEPVQSTGQHLVAHLGPGLLGQVYDGLQRPLYELAKVQGGFLQRGLSGDPLPQQKNWEFTPLLKTGDYANPGSALGWVPETATIHHMILTPPDAEGRIVQINAGNLRVGDTAVVLEDRSGAVRELPLFHAWAVRHPRPVRQRLSPSEPLATGTRVIDLLFPVAKGGAAIIPGGFGTGKTVTQQSLSRWSNVDIVVYVGCGERGNEMADVLEEFPQLEDPRTGLSLMERTVLIANTSNMPVAAREASIYTGITIAEYYRDMGLDVLMLADSTSRWGEALREISGRLEEIPGEEGFPAYLSSRLSQFYERTGRVIPLGRASPDGGNPHSGSVTLVGAVSPPGGDFSEPITQSSMRVAGAFWALDYDLSRRRHFPAINWTQSYSLYLLDRWYEENISPDWPALVKEVRALLRREADLLKIVQLVGQDALSEMEREILAAARLVREDLLQQSAFHEVDRWCPAAKTLAMLRVILDFHRGAIAAIQAGKTLECLLALPVLNEIGRMKEIPNDQAESELQTLQAAVQAAFKPAHAGEAGK